MSRFNQRKVFPAGPVEAEHTNAISVLSLIRVVRVALQVHLLNRQIGRVDNEVMVARSLSPDMILSFCLCLFAREWGKGKAYRFRSEMTELCRPSTPIKLGRLVNGF